MTRSPFKNLSRRSKKLLAVIGGLVALFVLLNYIVMPMYVNHGSRLTVPHVVGLTLIDAKKSLDSLRFQPVEADVRPDPTHAAGTVVFQNPLPGAIVKEGRRVYLTVSGGEEMVSVPLLRGRSLRDAKFSLERFGLQLGAAVYANSEMFPENTIIDQSVRADTKVPKGTKVSITVSQGKMTEATTVPQLAGKTLGEAEKILAGAGLRVGNVTYQQSFDLLPNTVVDQFPRVGEPIQLGQKVDLFVVQVGKPTEEIQIPQR